MTKARCVHTSGKDKNGGKRKIRDGFRSEKSKHYRNFRITAIQASKNRVRRLSLEYEWIQKLLPSWNAQIVHQWWTKKSYENKSKEPQETQEETEEETDESD